MKVPPAISMKTNKTGSVCQPEKTRFLQELAERGDILYKPSGVLRESGAFLLRIELG
jgi:hypothetical protein